MIDADTMRGSIRPCLACGAFVDVIEWRKGSRFHIGGTCPNGHVIDTYGIAEPRKDVSL